MTLAVATAATLRLVRRESGLTVRIAVPASLDSESIELLIGQTAVRSPEERVTLDMRAVRFASPYALIVLLAIARTRGERPTLIIPANGFEDYLVQSGFLDEASRLFTIDGAIPPRRPTQGSALLPIARIGQGATDGALEHVFAALVRLLSRRAEALPASMEHLAAVITSSATLIANQTRGGLWITAQRYRFKSTLLGNALLVAVACDGVTLRDSSVVRGVDIESDAAAIESALNTGGPLHGVDSICRRSANQLSVRSGTARISRRSPLYDRRDRRSGLAPLSGVQLELLIASASSSPPRTTH